MDFFNKSLFFSRSVEENVNVNFFNSFFFFFFSTNKIVSLIEKEVENLLHQSAYPVKRILIII